jgi:hypothetical protein
LLLELTPFFEWEMTYIWGRLRSQKQAFELYGGINFGLVLWINFELVKTLTGAQPHGTQNAGSWLISCDALTFE